MKFKVSGFSILGVGVVAGALTLVTSFPDIQGPKPTRTLIGNEIKDLDFTDTLHVLLGDDDTISVSYLLQGDELILNLETAVGELGGWVGFGIGENKTGSMKGADIVTVTFDVNGVPSAVDRHLGWVAFPMSPETAFPERDVHQDWEVVEGAQANGILSVTIKRKIDTGDHEEDRVIDTENENRILVAKGPGQFIGYHRASRAGSALDFSRPLPSTDILDLVEGVDEVIDLRMTNYTGFRSHVTTYAQKAFSFEFDEAMDVIAIEPILTKANMAQLHHLTLIDCIVPHQVFPEEAFDTEAELLEVTHGFCVTIVYTWAVGGGPFIFPKEVGLRIGGTGLRTVTLEIHYDNPRLITIPDSSGIRMYATKTLRPNEAYVLNVGDPAFTFADLTAGDGCVSRKGTCNQACTSQFSQPLTVFGSMIHMHARGRQAYTRLNGEIVTKLDYWDFAFQHLKPIVPYTINPGDLLETVCNYDASTATADVPFSRGSLEEMCTNFIYYYPKDPMASNCGWYNSEDQDENSICAMQIYQGDQNQYGGGHLEYTNFLKQSAVCLNSVEAPNGSPYQTWSVVVAVLFAIVIATLV